MTDQNKPRWMKIHSGINDPKHRAALGKRIWLLFHMIDQVDWTTGIIEGWTDTIASEEMVLPFATLKRWRQELQELGYITCYKAFQSQRIVIHKWRDPRQVTPIQLNVKGGIRSESNVVNGIKSDPPSNKRSDPPSNKRSDPASYSTDSKHNTPPEKASREPVPSNAEKIIPIQDSAILVESDELQITPPSKKETPHAAMKNAIIATFGWEAKDVTVWGEIDSASKKLRKVECGLEELPALHRYCKGRFDFFGPMCLAKYWPDYVKSRRAKNSQPLTVDYDAVPARADDFIRMGENA